MTPAMNSPLMTLGSAKPPLQVQVASRQFIERADKQSRQEAGHRGRHVLGERRPLPRELSAEFLKRTATVLLRTLSRVEHVGNGLDLLHLGQQFFLNLLDRLQPAVYACR